MTTINLNGVHELAVTFNGVTTATISAGVVSLDNVPVVNTPAVAHEWISAYNATTGALTQSQPAFTDISGVASPSQLPTPTSTTIGGVEAAGPVTNQWVSAITTAGAVTLSQPSAANLSNGTTGTGAVVLATSPTITTPTISGDITFSSAGGGIYGPNESTGQLLADDAATGAGGWNFACSTTSTYGWRFWKGLPGTTQIAQLSPAGGLSVIGGLAAASLVTGNTSLVMEQTGDVYGTTSLTLLNRNGNNGALLVNVGLDLCDFMLESSTSNAGLVRFEHRSADLVNSTNTAGEVQLWAGPISPGLTDVASFGASVATLKTNYISVVSGATVNVGVLTATESAAVQGTTLNWNITGGQGETDFINARPSSAPGGFYWYNLVDGVTSVGSPIMTLNGSGELACAQVAVAGPVSFSGICASSSTVTVTATGTATVLAGSSVYSGLLCMRDNTLGGSALFLIDPNGGCQLIGTSQIQGITASSNVAWNGSNFQVTLNAGASVPKVIAWGIHGT